MRATVQSKLGDIKLGAMYQTQESTGEVKYESDGYALNAAYGLGKATLKAQYQSIDFDGGDNKNVVSVGVDYKLAKNTKLFGFYSTFDNDSSEDESYLGLGIEYKF